MATLRFVLKDSAQGDAAVASTESGSGSGCEIILTFDSRVVASAVIIPAFYALVETVTSA